MATEEGNDFDIYSLTCPCPVITISYVGGDVYI
jgi:hypothetical protein